MVCKILQNYYMHRNSYDVTASFNVDINSFIYSLFLFQNKIYVVSPLSFGHRSEKNARNYILPSEQLKILYPNLQAGLTNTFWTEICCFVSFMYKQSTLYTRSAIL